MEGREGFHVCSKVNEYNKSLFFNIAQIWFIFHLGDAIVHKLTPDKLRTEALSCFAQTTLAPSDHARLCVRHIALGEQTPKYIYKNLPNRVDKTSECAPTMIMQHSL